MAIPDDRDRCQYWSYDGQCQRRAKVGGLCRQHQKIVAAQKARKQGAAMPATPTTDRRVYLSLGAGVQSSTLALMAARGEITPMPVAAIFADTQWEPAAVYRWLDWLEKQLPYPVHRVTAGSLRAALSETKRSKRGGTYLKAPLPVHLLASDGSGSIMARHCTRDYKIAPQERWFRAHRQNGERIIRWLGISVDEAHRMKPSRVAWIEHRWPLVDEGMTRAACLAWMSRRGYPAPPRSACCGCPFHSDAEWARLTPAELADAAAAEREIQVAVKRCDGFRDTPYLHRSLRPLDTITFDPLAKHPNLFGNECEGMCGV